VPDGDGEFPNRQYRQKIEARLRKIVHEHLLIFPDEQNRIQIWQWVYRKPGQPARYREYRFEKGQTYEALIQKLDAIVINLEDEEGIRLLDVTIKLKDAFDKDRVTKRFYDRFKKQQTTFRAFIEGIPDNENRQWYSALMLNRLMFIYFIQKKAFLDNDVNYLRNKLAQMQSKYGHDQFYSFYRFFLRRLFHDGLNRKEPRGEELDRLLGNIPYLNGGIFEEHILEKKYPNIDIKDEAFEKLFTFFDQYQWHLDDRPLRADNEINPDVLGYIFEKYVNQKELGAYYTKEDITEYISKNTIIPSLFDKAQKECKIAFEGVRSVWDLLIEDPDRYIYDAVKKGVVNDGFSKTTEIERATLAQVPYNIAIGLDTSKPNLLERRKDWNTRTPQQLALPTEIWRETIARWQRYFEVRKKLEKGEIRSINDFITYNLNIRQFAQDVIENAEGPELIRAFYKAITRITILDPTVGSGAFLFAASNILEPLYEACLDRMQAFIDELPEDANPKKFSDFKNTLKKMSAHPNRTYFVYKSIIINNLYGVDILDEAVEICKLRLFLKLVAQIEQVEHIEPLPDIDFNIRSGNTLVGYTNVEGVKKGVAADLFAGKQAVQIMRRITNQVEDVEALFDVFHLAQIEDDESALEFKNELKQKLKTVEEELNRYLAGEYGVDHTNQEEYTRWLETHKPFHWFVEFYGILKNSGFDVIIGNPPYVEYSKVRKDYIIKGYKTEKCGNLYAFVIEKSYSLMHNGSRQSMIVQLPMVCTDRMIPLQNVCIDNSIKLWFVSFDDRPSKLFDGLQHIRATIFSSKKEQTKNPTIFTTKYNRWYSEMRKHLFKILEFEMVSDVIMTGAIPKIGTSTGKSVVEKIIKRSKIAKLKTSRPSKILYFHNSPQYWVRSMTYAPYFWNERDGQKVSTQMKIFPVSDNSTKFIITAILNSSVFYWWFIILSDCRHLNNREIESFGFNIADLSDKDKMKFKNIVDSLMNGYEKHKQRKKTFYNTTGNVMYDEYYPRFSKPIIDRIDKMLASHYRFSEVELDFIINYDIKYRMGKELNA
jgi:hypothetical protein